MYNYHAYAALHHLVTWLIPAFPGSLVDPGRPVSTSLQSLLPRTPRPVSHTPENELSTGHSGFWHTL